MQKGKTALLLLGLSAAASVMMMTWPGPKPMEVETAVIGCGELVQMIVLQGETVYGGQQPCICPSAGRISRIYVQEGQRVQAGDLLFKMDTSREEQALSALYENRFTYSSALSGLDEIAQTFGMQREQEWQNAEAGLLQAIVLAQIRAADDCVVETIYLQEGDWAAGGALLGLLRGSELKAAAAVSVRETFPFERGDAALVRTAEGTFPVQYEKRMLSEDGTMQTLCFGFQGEPVDILPGEHAVIEIAHSCEPSTALAPLAAFDANGNVWRIKNGKAFSSEPAFGKSNHAYAAVGMDWVNETVILHPDFYDLSEGTRVQVKK